MKHFLGYPVCNTLMCLAYTVGGGQSSLLRLLRELKALSFPSSRGGGGCCLPQSPGHPVGATHRRPTGGGGGQAVVGGPGGPGGGGLGAGDE